MIDYRNLFAITFDSCQLFPLLALLNCCSCYCNSFQFITFILLLFISITNPQYRAYWRMTNHIIYNSICLWIMKAQQESIKFIKYCTSKVTFKCYIIISTSINYVNDTVDKHTIDVPGVMLCSFRHDLDA